MSFSELVQSAWNYLTDPRALVQVGGYVGLTAIIFAETGLLVGFFLPGDSLLVTAGLFAAKGDLDVVYLGVLLSVAAIVGDAVGFAIGRVVGSKLYERPDSLLFRRKHLMAAHEFYEKHGGKTIIFARFIPIIRTFAPTVAGVANMSYRRFAIFNVTGGLLWIWSLLLAGYGLGATVPNIEENIHIIVVVVVILSILPAVFHFVKERKKAKEPV